MGGSRPSAPTYFRHQPTAPIIYQTIQSQEGWDAADDFLKRLRSDGDAIVKDQASVLGAKNAAAYASEKSKYQSAATTPDNPMWKAEQAARSKVSAADSAWDKANQLAVSAKNLTDKKRQQTQLSSLKAQQGSGYTPPKPSGSK